MTMPDDNRRPIHLRDIQYRSFARPDGLFDIEGYLRDTKAHALTDRERGPMPPGTPLHDIVAVLTIGTDMVVRDFRYEMRAVPFGYCQQAVDPSRLIGASLARGWRRALAEAFGLHGGCTHLREMMFGMGTVAFQTLSTLGDEQMFAAGGRDAERTDRPFYLGGCHSWAIDSPVVERFFPQFHQPRAAGEGQ